MDNLELRMSDVPDRDHARRLVEGEVRKLVRQIGSVTSCHVAIERPNAHPNSGARWRTRVEVRLAGQDPFVVRREQGDGAIYDELSTIVHDTFAAARRKAHELQRQMRGEVKRHVATDIAGVISELHPDYGIVFTSDGRKIYFHAHSVVDYPFEDLREGMGVAFEEETGDEGPQASSLRVVDARGADHPLPIPGSPEWTER